MYVCCICQEHARNTLVGVLRHIRNVHPHFQSRVVCGLNGCVATPSSFQALRLHIYRYHRNLLNVPVAEVDGNVQDDCDLPSSVNNNQQQAEDQDGDYISLPSTELTTSAIIGAEFILKTRDGKGLTQVATNQITQDVTYTIASVVDRLKSSLMNKIEEMNLAELSDHEKVELENVFSDEAIICPFKGLETDYKQESFISEHFNYVVPVQRTLGHTRVIVSGRTKDVIDYCYDVPLLQSIQALLKNDCVLEQIFNSHKSNHGSMGDFCDGTQFQESKLFQEDPCALQIRIYYDDVEVCNALGSKTKKHKLGLFYYTLGNVEPKYRSSLHFIQLLTVVKTQLIAKYGINEILKPLVRDISLLETDNGVPFNVEGQVVNFRGTLTICSADNPAACLLGGYKNLHSAIRKCRTCMAVESDMQTTFTEANLQLRSHFTHASHVADLNGPLHDHIATTYGITEQSILNSLQYFHVVDGLVPDIMHDILEGTVQLTLKCLLCYLIFDCKFFNLNTLNERIKSFDYGRAECRNKPSEIARKTLLSSDSYSLKQSATQAWCLARFFPLLVGDLVPEGDQRWQNFLILLRIMEFVFATKISNDEVNYLEMLIEEFLQDFCTLYPDRTVVPKMHYLVHVPSWIRKCGPLVHCWCMRYEGKHKFFKKILNVVGNYKNVEKTVATRHQRFMCFKMTCTNYLGGDTETGSISLVMVNTLHYMDELLQQYPNVPNEVQRLSFVKFYGTQYSKGSIVFYAIMDDVPVFGKIIDILYADDFLLVLQPYVGNSFCKHLNAYDVDILDNVVICTPHNLIDHHPLSIHHSFDNTLHNSYICLKYNVTD